MKKEREHKDSTIFNLRLRSYLEGLGEAERQAVNASAHSEAIGLPRAVFDKVITKAISDLSHPLHVIPNPYRQATDRTDLPSAQVKQKGNNLFPHFSWNIHKYFEAQDEFEVPRNLDMHDALLAKMLIALKQTRAKDAEDEVDALRIVLALFDIVGPKQPKAHNAYHQRDMKEGGDEGRKRREIENKWKRKGEDDEGEEEGALRKSRRTQALWNIEKPTTNLQYPLYL